ncbi:MAG: hypothetical protein A2087_14865 [Spirochaetes bacterium GWD1_61_31]|nr:MAG: hypothetical protein A2Y37_09815 [Spirochaetes bacterium GWB1_60_80]OHD31704.1 MAG: hypothetical protein A2004_03360 [Spirochaetes bacterium GWC1_61_12]OHD36247.1 MAG: hypothetical protein A2087_14865 [Spirochaetes bacterium GWD1_61_31]OHD41502.1 MAG: hypothetical protein A2Y35_06120 [Spirochaetes bacterium GWE1_60_18]OHD61404.1 MAG: hypothetical protein A2Y32_04510 [Spirochaetes bacterium GWF1_60_12]HAP44535.1 GntR family transcriptional regulator [Spirochaetaceae bacterium]
MKKTVPPFSPIVAHSLKDEFISRFETLILSGQFKVGERVPSERDLGVMFGVSRPVVHEGMRTLESRGLVTIESRKGVRINDYRRQGSIELLLSIFNYSGGKLAPTLFDGILAIRVLFEVETAGLAARHRTDQHIAELEQILEREQTGTDWTPAALSQLDYDFHIEIAIASGNEIYPLLINSFRKIYMAILVEFYHDTSSLKHIFDVHRQMVTAIINRDEVGARAGMTDLLTFGEDTLRGQVMLKV